MKRLSGYPNWFFWLLTLSLLAVIASGLFMLPWVAEFKLQWDMDFQLAFSYRLPAVVVHVLFGWTLLMVLGALWHSHIRAGWRKKRNHISGLIQSFSLLLLALSGIGLYYLGSESAQLIASLLHTGVGLMLSGAFVWHYYHGLKIRRELRVATHRRHQYAPVYAEKSATPSAVKPKDILDISPN